MAEFTYFLMTRALDGDYDYDHDYDDFLSRSFGRYSTMVEAISNGVLPVSFFFHRQVPNSPLFARYYQRSTITPAAVDDATSTNG